MIGRVARPGRRNAPGTGRSLRVHRAARTAVLVVAATVALVAAGTASAQISTITAINRARESTAAAHAPQAPGIARVTGSYDTAGVLSIDVAFRHPLTALQASH